MEFADVLGQELESITIRRSRVRRMAPRPPGATTTVAQDPVPRGDPDAEGDPTPPEKRARLAAMDRHLAGLALSGGGIRSATFALGVLQGLAHLRLLSRFDYLSTVSGGGYIGGWLAAWIKREGNPLSVEAQLATGRISEARADRAVIGSGRIVDEEPEPIHHLRSYSNYLTPRPGLLSVDTWTVLVIYVRNAVINLLLLLPLTMIVVLLGRCLIWFYANTGPSEALRTGIVISLALLLVVAFLSLTIEISGMLAVKAGVPRPTASRKRRRGIPVILATTILGPMIAAAALACWSFSFAPGPGIVGGPGPPGDDPLTRSRLPSAFAPAGRALVGGLLDGHLLVSQESSSGPGGGSTGSVQPERGPSLIAALGFGLGFGVLALAVHVFGYLVFLAYRLVPGTSGRQQGEERRRSAGVIWMATATFMAGGTGGFLFYTMVSQVLWRLGDQPYAVATLGPPLALLVVVAATFVEVWLLGRWEGDDLREWWARICAWLVIVAAAWLVFFGTTLYGPMAANHWLLGPRLQAGMLVGWLTTGMGGALAGRRPEAKQGGGPWWLKLLVRVAPPVFAVGLLVVVAMLVDFLVFAPLDHRVRLVAAATPGSPVDSSAPAVYWLGIMQTTIEQIGVVLAACAVLVGLATGMSNVNLFSLNSMYANRLTRCYLGASRPRREWEARGPGWRPGPGGAPTAARGPVRWENTVTGFDPEDDIPLWSLRIGPEPVAAAPGSQPETEYLGPHLVMNTALNLVAGDELAWQDRRAESFVLTPTHSGSKGTGYAATTPQTGRELSLGRAMSISGAAVDSNIGLHQSSALIALMTAFNARLGWWIKNPDPSTWRPRWLPARGDSPTWDAQSPSLALPLLMELLGQTNETQKWVHISDGGHFENLGVYELIRRRCRYIVCCDAGTDPQASDDNLANMIRLCRTDFGVRIEVDTSPLARRGPDELSRWHCVVGRIRYDDVDGGERPGILVLLRTSMTGDEPPDVQEYASKNPEFPWQSTIDQFFNEPQFESYRALGFHVARTAFKDALDDVNNTGPLWSNEDPEIEFKRGNQRLFSAVQRRWAPAPSNREDASTPAIRSWDKFQEALRREGDLASLSLEIYPELQSLGPPGPGVPQLHAVAQMIEALEDAWADLRMGDSFDSPENRGWMSVFRRWTGTPILRRLWPILRGEFSQDFVKFCETQLELGVRIEAVPRSRLDPTFFEAARTFIGAEFAREWPRERPLDDLIRDAERDWQGWAENQPILLIILAPPGGGEVADSPDKIACGIVFASRVASGGPARDEPARFDLFFWMRRPYRGMGIASRCALSILTDLRDAPRHVPEPRAFTIQTRYPAGATGLEDGRDAGMEYHLWSAFFSHYDFRCPRGREAVRGGYWVIERTFRPEELEL